MQKYKFLDSSNCWDPRKKIPT